MPGSKNKSQLRLRVFAGPNGSGKSTIVKAVAETVINDKKIDLGTYINADDIAFALHQNKFSFRSYKITTSGRELLNFATSSGLLNKTFTRQMLSNSFSLSSNSLILKKNERKNNLPKYWPGF